MLQAQLTCVKQIGNLPRSIDKKKIKQLDLIKKYSSLFRKNKNYEKSFYL